MIVADFRDTKIKKWLKAGLNIYGHYRETSKPRITEYDGLIQQSMYFPSTIEPKNEEGEYNNSFFDGGYILMLCCCFLLKAATNDS